MSGNHLSERDRLTHAATGWPCSEDDRDIKLSSFPGISMAPKNLAGGISLSFLVQGFSWRPQSAEYISVQRSKSFTPLGLAHCHLLLKLQIHSMPCINHAIKSDNCKPALGAALGCKYSHSGTVKIIIRSCVALPDFLPLNLYSVTLIGWWWTSRLLTICQGCLGLLRWGVWFFPQSLDVTVVKVELQTDRLSLLDCSVCNALYLHLLFNWNNEIYMLEKSSI